MKYFGATIEIAQHTWYTDYTLNEEWKYLLFGHFDKMKIKLAENINSFINDKEDSYIKSIEKKTAKSRMNSSPEMQKFFLYCKNDKNNNKQKLIKRYEDGDSPHNFVGLIFVKFYRQYLDALFAHKPDAELCEITENIINRFRSRKPDKFNDEKFSICVMNSLGLDEVCILISAPTPNGILRCKYYMQPLLSEYKSEDDKFIPVVLQTHTIIGNKIGMKSKDLSGLSDLEDVNGLEGLELLKSLRDLERFKNSKKFKDGKNSTALKILQEIKSLEDLKDLKEKYEENNVLIRLQMQVRPGASLFLEPPVPDRNDNDKLSKHKWSGMNDTQWCTECDQPSRDGAFMHLSLGQYGYRMWDDVYKLKDFISMYEKPPFSFEEKESEEKEPVIHKSMRDFLIPKYIINEISQAKFEKDIKRKDELFQEEATKSREKVEELSDRAGEIFNEINNSGILQDEKFSFLKPLVNEMARLHILGCQRFLDMFPWYDIKGIVDFFKDLYEKMLDMFLLMNKEQKDETKFNYANQLVEGLEFAIRALNDLFNDRLLPDVVMRENVRNSTYAAGAYDGLLKIYSKWIKDICSVIAEVKGVYNGNTANKDETTSDIKFLLVPSTANDVHTHRLFKINDTLRTPIICHANIDQLLDVPNALAGFIHECGHYVGIFGRERRVSDYLRIVSYMFSKRLAKALCVRNYLPIPYEFVRPYAEELGRVLYEYLECKLEALKGQKDLVEQRKRTHLDYAEILYKDSMYEIFEKLTDDYSEPKISEEEKPVIQAFVRLYDKLEIVPSINFYSYEFNYLLDGLLGDNSIDMFCKKFIREVAADLPMIQLLELSSVDYIIIFLKALKITKTKLFELKAPIGDDPHESIDILYVRVMCALIQTVFVREYSAEDTSKENLEKVYEESVLPNLIYKMAKVIKDVDKEMKKVPEFAAEYQNTWADLKKILEQVIEAGNNPEKFEKEANSNLQEWLMVTSHIGCYFFMCGVRFKKALAKLVKAKNPTLKSIRSLYKDVKNKQLFEQLALLFKRK